MPLASLGRISRPIVCLLALACLLAASTAGAAAPRPWRGQVVGVHDGDTVTVMRKGKGVRVRFFGIDAPEHAQPFGQAAKQFLSDMCFGAEVLVEPETKDRYQRVVANLYLPDGRWLNGEMVKAGLAWHYSRYSQDVRLAFWEGQARLSRKGLWSEPGAVAPWRWRKARR